MPNHVHAILWFPAEGQLSECMKQWKRTSSVKVRKLLEQHLARYRDKVPGDPVWQAKYYAFNIYSRRKMEEKLRYIHANPVRAGLVRQATEWRWSSAKYYELGRSVGVKVGWIE
jgi:putative transposase